MPIAREEFESYDPTAYRTNAERVLAFFEENPKQAFKALEIAEATGVHEHSIHPVLGRLVAEGAVRHKSPYWALADDGWREGRRDEPREGRRGGQPEGRRDGRQGHDRENGNDDDGWPRYAVRHHRSDR